MKRVSTSALVPGMVTAEEVFNYKGSLILPKGHVLTAESIEKLEFYSVINVRVEEEADQEAEDIEAEHSLNITLDMELDSVVQPGGEEEPETLSEDAENTEPEDLLIAEEDMDWSFLDGGEEAADRSEPPLDTFDEETAEAESEQEEAAEPVEAADTENIAAPIEEPPYSERLRQTEEFQKFEQDFREATTSFRESMSEIIENVENLDVDELISNTLTLLSDENKFVNVFDMLHSMRQTDDNTYVHCMNVGLMCNILARWMKMSEDDIKTATVCGLLHDIGKLKIPEKILKKPGRLTDWELSVVRTHPREGYNILLSAPVNDHIKNAALMHHERCDGSGYPLKLTSAQIDPFAKIVAIADVYDAMTSSRVYRSPQCPFEAIAAFEKEGLQKYDPAFILTFLKNIVNTYILHRVHLTNGEEGDIVYINPDKLSRPTVRVGNRYVDLSKEAHIHIDALI